MRLKEIFLTGLLALMPTGLTHVSDYFSKQTQEALTQQNLSNLKDITTLSTTKQLTAGQIKQAFVQAKREDIGALETLPEKEFKVEQEQEQSTDNPSTDNESISTSPTTTNVSSTIRKVSSKDGLWVQTVDYTHKQFPKTVGGFAFSPQATYYELIHPERLIHIIGMCELKQDTTTGEYTITYLGYRKEEGWGPSSYGRTYLGNKINLPKYFGSLVKKMIAKETKAIESEDIQQDPEMSQPVGREDNQITHSGDKYSASYIKKFPSKNAGARHVGYKPNRKNHATMRR